MGRKQKSHSVLNRFLDIIGLVDNDQGDEFEPEIEKHTRSRAASSRRANEDDFDDEFADYEAPKRNTGRSASRVNVEDTDDEFSEDQGWSSARPSGASRSAQTARRPQSAAQQRPTANRYGSASANAAGSTRRTASDMNRSYAGESGRARASAYAGSPSSRSQQSRSYAASGYAAQSYGEPERASRSHASQREEDRHQTLICRLRSVEECRDVILALIDKKTVLLNLEALDTVQTQRALDTMSGAAYAIGAKLSGASDRTYLITPSNVSVEQNDNDERGY